MNVFGYEGIEEGAEPEAPPQDDAQEQVAAPEEEQPPAEEPPQEEPQAEEAPKTEASDDDEEEGLAEDEEGFQIGNRKYRNVESADRAFKRTLGRLQRTDRENNELKQERARLLAIVEGMSKVPPPQPPPPEVKAPEPTAKPQRLADLIDDDEADRLVAEGGPGALLRRFAELTEERLAKVVDERTAPVQELAAERQWRDATVKLFDGAFALTDESGKRVYPELDIDNDPDTANAVYAIWQRNAADPDLNHLALKQKAIDLAVKEYRATRPSAPQPTAPSKPSTPTIVLQARKADKSIVGSSGSVRPTGARSGNGHADEGWLADRAAKHEVFGAIG